MGGRLGPHSLQENVQERVGIGRSATSEQTTATLPSIPPRCSRLHTHPPSNPTSSGDWPGSGEGASAAGEEHACSASSCCCSARCWPCRLGSLRISSALIWAPLSFFSRLLATRYGKATPCQHRCFLQGCTDGSSLQLDEQRIGWAPPAPTPLTAKAPSWHLHASERRRDHPARRSFQSALLFPTVWTRVVLLFPSPDRLLQCLSHGRLSCLLNTLFHL